jgi:hypothetical protein
MLTTLLLLLLLLLLELISSHWAACCCRAATAVTTSFMAGRLRRSGSLHASSTSMAKPAHQHGKASRNY